MKGDSSVVDNEANAILIENAKKLNVPAQAYEVTLALPSGFAIDGAKLSIKHIKGSSVEYYTGTVSEASSISEDLKPIFVTFTTNGFSPFVIYAASANVASIGDGANQKVYPTLQAAIDAVKDNETINVTGTGLSATVSGSKTFKVTGQTVNLTAASGYNLTNSGDTYTVSHQSSGGPGSFGGSISTPTTYAVNVNAATNGAVAADKKTASKGTMVTVTASPSKGYVVDAVKVVDKDGKDVAVTGKDGKYVFTMPASAVTVTGSFKAETPAPVALPFTDVKSGNWFYDAVKYAYAQGLMTGTSATTFAPNGTMNRAMIVTVLYRLEKSPAVTGASKFTDVPAGQWYSDAVAWAAANKIVNGYDETTFGPMNAVTREQMAAILFRYEQVKGLENVTLEENLNRFPDQNKISAYAIPALQWAVGQKIINGNADGTLDPTGTATRAQVAQIFTNLLNK
ncbi:MAG: S-layer homology domain-containing protein [Clostridiales bacterium]|nr:S-layer homology domain-containing protein [Clostridiales bacterium]